MKLQPVFASQWRRAVIEFRRYFLNTIMEVAAVFLTFVMALIGIRVLGGPMAAGQTVEMMVLGYFMWTVGMFSFSQQYWEIVMAAQTGTLEQLYLSPAGFRLVSLFSTAAALIFNLFFAVVMLALALVVSGRALHLDIVSMVPILLLVVVQMTGLGFVLGGLTLVFKRVQALHQVLQFVFIGCMVVPLAKYPLARCLPLTAATNLGGTVMIDGARLWQLGAADLGALVAVSAAYLALGLLVFGWCERAARDRGLLGQY
jgi:ABC-2 type transport system permease protein